MKMEKINMQIAKVKEKISIQQVHLRDLEKLKTEQENIEILQAVRSIAVSPEDVKTLLSQIRKENMKEINQYVKDEN